MKMRTCFVLLASLILFSIGCSKANTATPPEGGGLTESQINTLEPKGEVFGRPVSDEPIEEGATPAK
jgi:hypothetical protein